MRKVLVTATNYSKYCAEAKKMLEDHGCEVVENPFGRPMIFEELKSYVTDVDAVIVGVDTWNEEVFKLAPQLKVMSRFGVGVDNILCTPHTAGETYETYTAISLETAEAILDVLNGRKPRNLLNG